MLESELYLSHAPAQPTSEGVLVNLSMGGACLECPIAFPVDSTLKLSIDAPNVWDPILVEAKVAWSRLVDPRGLAQVGVRFLHQSDKHLMPLAEVLANNPYV